MKAQDLLTRIMMEAEREDRNFSRLEFNIRDRGIVMNYEYMDGAGTGDVHRPSHIKDPEVLDLETFGELKPLLYEKNIPFKERRDDFL